jgi:hypothetical protein
MTTSDNKCVDSAADVVYGHGMAQKKGKIPTVYFGVRLPADVVARVRQRALDNDRAIGAEMARMLRCALDGTSYLSLSAAETAKRTELAREFTERVLEEDARHVERERAKRKVARAAKRKTGREK